MQQGDEESWYSTHDKKEYRCCKLKSFRLVITTKLETSSKKKSTKVEYKKGSDGNLTPIITFKNFSLRATME